MSSDNWQTQLNTQEKQTFLDFFKKVDADNKGIVLHDEAMVFLKKSDIPQNILNQFWSACDNENKGFLTEQEFYTILKLIACAQHGVITAEPILTTQVALPQFDSEGTPPQPQINRNNTINRPPMPTPHQQDLISPEDRQKYIVLFNSFGPENNILSGDRARAAFVQSNLPPAILQAIWNLADTRKSGSLNQTEFIIAIHYIERAMKGNTNLPSTLPASVYSSATGRPMASPLIRNNTLNIQSPPPIPARSPTIMRRPAATVSIPPEEYSKYKTFFNQLDTDRSGFVSGQDAVVFFRHSKLPESELARIWDLADTNSTGQLSEQEFAMAMHMINLRVSGNEIPSALPNFQFPMVNNNQQPPPPQQQQQNVDLLGLSDFTDNTPAPFAAPAAPPAQQQQFDFVKNNINAESNRLNAAQQNYTTESQNNQELTKQIEQQKELLQKLKSEADQMEQRLQLEKQRKEELLKQLDSFQTTTKEYRTRIETAQEETAQVGKEIEQLEKEKNSSNVFSLSQATSPVASQSTGLFAKVNETSRSPLFAKVNENTTESPLFAKLNESSSGGGLFSKVNENNTGGLFAKINETPDHSSSGFFAKVNDNTTSADSPKVFDPFAGFKASNSTPISTPTMSMNELKQEKEEVLKRSATPPTTSSLDISDIESKFPDLSTMEQNLAPPAPPVSAPPAPAAVLSPPPAPKESPSMFKKTPVVSTPLTTTTVEAPKNPSVSKYGFDLSAFETSSSTPNNNSNASMKDELSSLFGSPSTATTHLPAKNDGFDNIFGGTTATTKPTTTTSFEDIFFQNK